MRCIQHLICGTLSFENDWLVTKALANCEPIQRSSCGVLDSSAALLHIKISKDSYSDIPRTDEAVRSMRRQRAHVRRNGRACLFPHAKPVIQLLVGQGKDHIWSSPIKRGPWYVPDRFFIHVGTRLGVDLHLSLGCEV